MAAQPPARARPGDAGASAVPLPGGGAVSVFAFDGPAWISFSGGRTSGLMLRRCLDAGLSADAHVLFANTGKEREETLEFVDACARAWGVKVVWVERGDDGGHREVTFETASRNGEPFEALIDRRNFLPNPVTRFCTQELKIRVMKSWMRAAGYDHWTNVVGLRADEPRRVARMRAGEGRERWDLAFPLFDAGITVDDVRAFWRAQPFDLRLNPWEGNCDLCFLKGRVKRERVIRDRPDLATWWIDQEARPRSSDETGGRFRYDSPSYKDLFALSQRPMLFSPEQLAPPEQELDDLGDCVCSEDA